MTLGEFVKFLILLLRRERIDLSLHNRKHWHLMLYQLKKLELSETPRFLSELFFDADRTYPWCRELDEYIAGLCIAGCMRWSGSFQNYWLPEGIALRWTAEYERLGADEKRFLEDVALGIAREELVG
jgi:hypothetical protein